MYNHSALGGTFDHLHLGHKAIIDFALKNAKKISIGIATSKLYQNKEFNRTIEHFNYRKEVIEKYLSSIGALDRVDLFELNDIYGSTLTDNSLDSIVVTYETEPNAVRINEERLKKGLKPLKILNCPFVKGSDNTVIRSTDIRSGSINRLGLAYTSLFPANILYLPKELRKELKKPLATPVFKHDEITTATEVAETLNKNAVLTIGIGDIVNKTLIEAGFTPDIQIIDFKTRRQTIKRSLINSNKIQYKNAAGTLYKSTIIELSNAIRKFLRDKDKKTLIIDGEEDLLTLPAILFAPLNSYIVYGQFEQGIVFVKVTEDLKEKITKIVKKFSSTPQ